MELLVSAAVVCVLVVLYVTWLAGRIDRLQARVAAAQSALDAQLVRRAAIAVQLAEAREQQIGARALAVRTAAKVALQAEVDHREAAENDLTRALHGLPLDADDPVVIELAVASRRLGVARQVHNDAVRDTLALRRRRLPRALRLGRRHRLPTYFDIAEFTVATVPPAPGVGEATPGPGGPAAGQQ